jgi:hypothetical protein
MLNYPAASCPKKGRFMLKNGRTSAVDGLAFLGCACHNSPNARRQARHSAKAKGKASWKRLARRGTSEGW